MVFVGEGLVVSANSSNSSIPSVTPKDLKEWILRWNFILCILCLVEPDQLESVNNVISYEALAALKIDE